MSDRLLHVVSNYGRIRRNLFLECMCELAGSSGKPWADHDQRFGGLITERAMDAIGHIDFSYSLDAYLASRSWSEDPGPNWSRQRYDPDRLTFVESQATPAFCLLAYRDPYSSAPIYYLRDGKRSCRINRDWGRYAALRRV